MKKILFIAFLTSALSGFGQNALDEMIAAEKSFAAYAVANNTVDAFLKFMDTSAVMFRNGEPYKAYNDWAKREKRPGILNWWPRYAETANSGDWGYTCGYWTFQPASINDTFAGTGYFFTVWQKNKEGEWKFILDVGTDSSRIDLSKELTTFNAVRTGAAEQSLREAEEAYHLAFKKKEGQANGNFMLPTTIVNSNWGGLLQRKDELHLPKDIDSWGIYDFTSQGSGIAPSGDLGYTYGSVTHSYAIKKETYLRIWRHSPTGWKIVVQMIRPVPVEKPRH